MIWRRWVTESSSSATQTSSDHLDRRPRNTRTRPPQSGFVQVGLWEVELERPTKRQQEGRKQSEIRAHLILVRGRKSRHRQQTCQTRVWQNDGFPATQGRIRLWPETRRARPAQKRIL